MSTETIISWSCKGDHLGSYISEQTQIDIFVLIGSFNYEAYDLSVATRILRSRSTKQVGEAKAAFLAQSAGISALERIIGAWSGLETCEPLCSAKKYEDYSHEPKESLDTCSY